MSSRVGHVIGSALVSDLGVMARIAPIVVVSIFLGLIRIALRTEPPNAVEHMSLRVLNRKRDQITQQEAAGLIRELSNIKCRVA